MPRLKADFEADLKAHARRMLTAEWGPEITTIDDANILIHFFDAERRRIAVRPRAVEKADDFTCPAEQDNGWNVLQQKVLRGEDLGPHMSKLHGSVLNGDGLLNEWGVHHFHLGTAADRQNPNYIERTGPVVFALVDDNCFRAINVYEHQTWQELSIIESLHRNWPDVIRPYRMQGVVGPSLTSTERGRIRRVGAQAAVTLQDGTVYGSIGGPVSFAGTKFDSVRNADRWIMEVRNLQASIANDLSPFMSALRESGYKGEEDIEAEMQIADSRYYIVFPQYELLVALSLSPSAS